MRTLSHSCPLERGRKIAALGTHAVALSDEDKRTLANGMRFFLPC